MTRSTRYQTCFGFLFALIATPVLATAHVSQEIREYCAKVYNQEACQQAAKEERALIAGHAKYVRRAGRTLEFTPLHGKVVKLIDELTDDGVNVSYRLADYLNDVDHFLVHVGFYEGEAYALVNIYDGSKIDVDAIPVMSPDRRHFITSDICPSYCQYRLQIWRRVPHEGRWFELAWSFTPYDSVASIEPRWLDNETIQLTKAVFTDEPYFGPGTGTTVKREIVYVQQSLEGWKLTNELPHRQ